MKITLEGWSRNHGRHTVIDEPLEDAKISDTSPSPSFNRGKLYIHRNTEDSAVSYVLYTKGVSLRLSGDYQVRLTLTPADILLLGYLCFHDLGMAAFAKAFGALSHVGDTLNTARNTLARGFSQWRQHITPPRLPPPSQH